MDDHHLSYITKLLKKHWGLGISKVFIQAWLWYWVFVKAFILASLVLLLDPKLIFSWCEVCINLGLKFVYGIYILGITSSLYWVGIDIRLQVIQPNRVMDTNVEYQVSAYIYWSKIVKIMWHIWFFITMIEFSPFFVKLVTKRKG